MPTRKKTNPRILSEEIYTYIANNSELGLTKKQVQECFNLYKKMLVSLLDSDYIQEDLEIYFPRLGHFYFNKYEGRKKGFVYNHPIGFTDSMEKIVLEEDELNHLQIKFEISNFIRTTFTKRTKGYDIKK